MKIQFFHSFGAFPHSGAAEPQTIPARRGKCRTTGRRSHSPHEINIMGNLLHQKCRNSSPTAYAVGHISVPSMFDSLEVKVLFTA